MNLRLPSATHRLVSRLDELGRVSDERDRLSRTFLSPAMGAANRLVGQWMRGANMTVREDEIGNLIGRLESKARRAQTLVLGSHLDTVIGAGRFDGALGVLLPIVALEVLAEQGVSLPFDVEVVGFSEEEGVRFGSAYLGSKGYTGRLRRADLALADRDGITVSQALEARSRCPVEPPRAAHKKGRLLGYLEVHIEQGPALEAVGLGLGVVTAIAGQTRTRVTWRGQAGHAGTTPMSLRRDALAGAAELVLAAERMAAAKPPLVATVGAMEVRPGAGNVIPGEVRHSLDVRHPKDPPRLAALRRLEREARAIALRRGLELDWQLVQDNSSVPCSPELTRLLAQSVRAAQGRCPRLASGAGHDGVIVSALAPIAMLFVRCRDGLSHHPNEYAAAEDLDLALEAVVDFLVRLARRVRA